MEKVEGSVQESNILCSVFVMKVVAAPFRLQMFKLARQAMKTLTEEFVEEQRRLAMKDERTRLRRLKDANIERTTLSSLLHHLVNDLVHEVWATARFATLVRFCEPLVMPPRMRARDAFSHLSSL